MRPSETDRRLRQAEYDKTHSQLERNIKGQFATPYTLATSIVSDALSRVDQPRNFLEPSCGTGAFLSAALDHSPNLAVTAIEKDTDVFDIADELWSSENVSVVHADFFDIASSIGEFDLLVTNPPYSRHHHLFAEDKARYGTVAEKLSGHHLSQLAGLHAYFILAGTSLLRSGGIASWLIPSELFSVNYGRAIRDYITSNVTIERIHFFDNDDLQFDDALVSSCVLVLRKKPTEKHDRALITSGDFDTPSRSEKVSISELAAIDKWQHFFSRNEPQANTRIGDYFAVKRGLSTGAESFYTKDRSEWHSLGIGDEWLTPVLPAPRFMRETTILADEEGWPLEYGRALLNIPVYVDESALPVAVQSYLSTCPAKVRDSYTAKHRKKWYSIEQRKPAPVVCTYMSRSNEQPFRFVRNRSNAVVTTAYLCLYPNGDYGDDELDSLCDSLNAIPPATLINSGREYGGGLRKLEPKELLSVPFCSEVRPFAERIL